MPARGRSSSRLLLVLLIIVGLVITAINFKVYLNAKRSPSSGGGAGTTKGDASAGGDDAANGGTSLDVPDLNNNNGVVVPATPAPVVSGGDSGVEETPKVKEEKRKEVLEEENGTGSGDGNHPAEEKKKKHRHVHKSNDGNKEHLIKHRHKKRHAHASGHGDSHGDEAGSAHHKKHRRRRHHAEEANADPATEEPAGEADTTPQPPPPPTDAKKAAKKKPRVQRHSSGKGGSYVSFDSNRNDFFHLSFDEAHQQFEENMKSDVGDIEQSSRKFKDYVEKDSAGIKLPTDDASLEKRYGIAVPEGGDGTGDGHVSATQFCDPRDYDFSPEKDKACLAYLSDIRNWRSIKPMSSILSTGRTIKFKVFYKHNNVAAAMKVSQKKFQLEPASEVMAFNADRVLGLNRVPPVAWLPFPIEFLQSATVLQDAFYSQWFDKFAVEFTHNHTASLFADGYNGKPCMNVSLQIWMADVHNADDTSMRPRHDFEKYLQVPKDSEHADKKVNPGTPLHDLIGEISDEFIFDYIIGNTDRWFGHNSFAVGGSKDNIPEEKRTKSKPRLAFIDQGSSFYRGGGPEQNSYTKDEKTNKLCRFRASTAAQLLEVTQAEGEKKTADGRANALYLAIKKRLPPGIFNLGSSRLLKSGGKRGASLAAKILDCIEKHGRDKVLYFRDLGEGDDVASHNDAKADGEEHHEGAAHVADE